MLDNLSNLTFTYSPSLSKFLRNDFILKYDILRKYAFKKRTKTDAHFRLKFKQMDSGNYWITGRPKRMDQKDPIKRQWISGSWREASLCTAKLL